MGPIDKEPAILDAALYGAIWHLHDNTHKGDAGPVHEAFDALHEHNTTRLLELVETQIALYRRANKGEE